MFAELPLHGRKTESKTKSLSRIEPYSVYSKLNIDVDIGWLRERSHITSWLKVKTSVALQLANVLANH